MRFLFLIPELVTDDLRGRLLQLAKRRPRVAKLPLLGGWFVHSTLVTKIAFGGTLNIMRHCALSRKRGGQSAV